MSMFTRNPVLEEMLEVVLKNQATEIALLKEQILLLKEQNLRLAQMQEAQIGHWAGHGTLTSHNANKMKEVHGQEMDEFKENASNAREQVAAEKKKSQQEAYDVRYAAMLR